MRDFEGRCKASGLAFPIEHVMNRLTELKEEEIKMAFGDEFVEKYTFFQQATK